MGELVRSHAHDLIFEPTESLATKILIAQEQVGRLEEKYEVEKGRRQKSRLWVVFLAGILLACGATMVFMWSLTAAANENLRKAGEELSIAEEKLRVEQALTDSQSQDLKNMREYRDIAYGYDKVVHEQLVTLDHYKEKLREKGNTLPRDIVDALDYDRDVKNWIAIAGDDLKKVEDSFKTKIDVIEKHISDIKLNIKAPDCFPGRLFGEDDKKCQ